MDQSLPLARRAAAEGIATFALVFAGCGAIVTDAHYHGALGTVDMRAVGAAAAIAIGGTVGLDALFGGAVTGASMNPARSFGPALAAGEWSDFWIYIAGPMLGAIIGALAYQMVRGDHPRREGERSGAHAVRLPA